MAVREHCEVIIVGGGIAGASLAYFLAARGLGDVVILEREDQPAYHSTGRSAAALVEFHRDPLIRRLMAQGAKFLRHPPSGFCDQPLVDRIGVVLPAAGPDWLDLAQLADAMLLEGIQPSLLSRHEALALLPEIQPALVDGALLLPEDGHIDVHALLSAYLRTLRQAGGEVRCGSDVRGILVENGSAVGVVTADGILRARWIVNAAGAWAGEIGKLAGALPIEFTPMRRTIITFSGPNERDLRRRPMVEFESHQVYIKPESGGLLSSPMDETPVPPCDVQPADEDIAIAADKVGAVAPALLPRSVRRKWAGLRTFAPDRRPVVGADARMRGFFWLAGQGGIGIETSAILGRIASDLLLDGSSAIPEAAALSPARFGQ